LVGLLEAQAAGGQRGALRRDTAVIETELGDIPRAAAVLAPLLDERPTGPPRVSEAEHLARLHRRAKERDRLAELYRSTAGLVRDKRTAAALLCAAGAIDLSRNRPLEAEESFVAAAKQSPRDVTSRAALVAIYRRTQRWREVGQVLSELTALVAHEDTRVRLLREHGALLHEQLGDARKARQVLEQALALSPDDPGAHHELAKLYDLARQWDKSVELRQRAVDLTKDARVQAILLMEMGQIEEKRNDEAAALSAYDRAARADGQLLDALRAQAALHRKARRSDRLLDVLRAELDRGVDVPRRLQIQLEVARLIQDGKADSEEALKAFLDVLALEPDNTLALTGVERIARAGGRWPELAQAFRRAPATPSNLRVLADALEHLGEWAELAVVRQAELEALSSPGEKSRLATQLAQLFEHKLGDLDGAARMLQIAAGTGHPGEQVHRELVRVLEQSQRWPELTAALERELAAVPSGAVDRQLALLVKLGELRRDKLGKPGDAALAYEAILERQPGHVAALAALESLYDRLGREKDLLRILELRAEGTADPRERAGLFGRIAEVKQQRGDIEGAIDGFMAAFSADPADRQTFTAMEKLCYSQERWAAAMTLYDTAIGLVESGQIRAYRLGDLYARRGQVQLQYLGQQDAAASSYMRVVELDPENDTAVKFLESIHTQKSDWSALIKAYELRAGLTRDDERRLDSLRRAARVAGAKVKDSVEAARLYQAILEVDASDPEALDALERFYERNEDWSKLVDVLRLRLNTAPAGDAATALLRRIAQICEEGLRDEGKAIEHYLRILEIAPGNKEALEALGRIYESTEQWAEFIDVTRRQIRVTTDRNLKALLYFKCGSVMEAKFGKEEDAIRYYDAAIKTSPSCLPAVHGLRDLYRRREDWPRVIQTLELEVKLWQDDKERAGVFAQIGRIYEQRLGQPDRAMHYYESALAVDPECLPANQSLFEHWFDAGEWNRALPLAQALAQKAMRDGDPTTRSEFYRRRGVVFQMTGDPRGAAESLIIALEIKPDNVAALDTLGELAKRHPDAYDFDATYRELDKLYKKRDEASTLVARVRVAQAVMKEREGDLDAAEALYEEAVTLAPGDFTILSALVDLHANMRRWSHAVDAIVRFLDSTPPPPDRVRLAAMMRQVELHADCEMDPHRAISVLREILRLAPTHQDAYYRLAQEQYLLGHYQDARAAVERVIELAAAPGNDVTPESLARYYYYRGRIIEVGGDVRGATSQYRRAIEYDPGYAPPALSLARRAAETGDQRTAETLLIDAAHAAMASQGPQAAVALQRGLARILLASGDRPAAIEAYRGILNVEPDNATDRVALAEIYAIDDPQRAVGELRKVIDRDIHHAPGYRLLSSFYTRLGEFDRAARVLSVMEQLGFAEDADRGAAAKARSMLAHQPLRRALDDEMRQRLLLSPAARDALGEVFMSMAQEVSALFPQPGFGENLVPLQTLDDPALKVAVADLTRMFSVDADLYIGEHVPGNVVVTAFPRRMVVIDRSLIAESDPSRRYLLGWAHEAIRGGYALLLHLGRRQRAELGSLLKALLLPEAERAGPTNDFVRALPKRAVKVLERHVGRGRDLDTEAWIDGMINSAKRGGLLACDDFAAATWMIARMSGENLGSDDATVALGAVLGGADLVRFYLSDDYHRLREALAAAAAPAT
ncbi:MAG: tetratricopeptide repeat protein, partial [Myxococcales bacterium]|nr:tetratricopeptide repeat protein [Myxococcales bacterium]